jgi:hypothetical protein
MLNKIKRAQLFRGVWLAVMKGAVSRMGHLPDLNAGYPQYDVYMRIV